MRRALAFGGAHLVGPAGDPVPATAADRHAARSTTVWVSVLGAGIACKAIFLAMAGVLSGGVALAELRPEDSVGLGAVVAIGDFLTPVGLALRHRRAPKAVLPDLLFLAGLSFLSFSKAAFIGGLLTYTAVLVLVRGTAHVKRALLNWRLVPLLGLVLLNLGVKSQQRAQSPIPGAESGGLVASAVGGSSARFLGGIHRTYFVVAREVVANGAPGMGGTYHAQVAYLWVPRALWPGKPRVAAEQLFYLLGVTEEAYGTAFAANAFGFLLLDFGLAGLWIGSAALGIALAVGDQSVPRLGALRTGGGFSTLGIGWRVVWITAGIPLSEGGIPMAAIHILLLGIALSAVYAFHNVTYSILAAAGGATNPPAGTQAVGAGAP
jgi:hypothetical protein